MKQNNNPLTPHLQIYRWQISSLLSIAHRIVGVINIIAITIICLWLISLLLGEVNYEFTKIFLQSFFGKFFIVFLCWTFSFHILNEIRHLAWDLGYGFDLKISKITGYLALVGSFVFAIIIYLLGKNFI
jgi:succinate dehydrogenase / fumarate reductase cytochrome b subunit